MGSFQLEESQKFSSILLGRRNGVGEGRRIACMGNCPQKKYGLVVMYFPEYSFDAVREHTNDSQTWLHNRNTWGDFQMPKCYGSTIGQLNQNLS